MQNTKRFFIGDVEKVQTFLNDNTDFNINCINFQGISALLIAVQSHNEDMVALLLVQRGIDVGRFTSLFDYHIYTTY